MASESIAAAIEKYAKKIKKNAVWLDWLDAILFSLEHQKNLGLVSHCGDVPLEILRANFFLRQIPGLQDLPDIPSLERNRDSWILISCNAGFDKSGQANHWVPAVFQELVPESVYIQLTHQAIAKSKVALAEIESEMHDLELEDDQAVRDAMQEQLAMQQAGYLGDCFILFYTGVVS